MGGTTQWVRGAVFVAVGLAVGCASQVTYSKTRVTLQLERSQLRELNEAYKSPEDKTVEVPAFGDVECPERTCYLPLTVTAERLKEGVADGPARVRGTLVFRRGVTTHMLDMMQRAEYAGRSMQEEGVIGKVQCDKRSCTLEFEFDANARTAQAHLVLAESATQEARGVASDAQ